MKITHISKNTIKANSWDGGKTYEYFIYPPKSNYSERNFLFRVSTASIEKQPSRFTKFENFNRFLMMLDNDLNIQRNGVEEYYSNQEIFSFDSNDEIISYSKGSDFNLIVHQSIKDVKVFLLKDTINLQDFFQLLFAKEEALIKVNQQAILLQANDLLVIENTNKEEIQIHSDTTIITGSLTLKK